MNDNLVLVWLLIACIVLLIVSSAMAWHGGYREGVKDQYEQQFLDADGWMHSDIPMALTNTSDPIKPMGDAGRLK